MGVHAKETDFTRGFIIEEFGIDYDAQKHILRKNSNNNFLKCSLDDMGG
jgi:hypothetical protein